MIEYIKLTVDDLEVTTAFREADKLLQDIYRQPHYVKGIAGFVTVAKYKGLDYMLSLYHMTDFKKAIVKELYETKVVNCRDKKNQVR